MSAEANTALYRWTSERPTEPGWYWLEHEQNDVLEVVRVTGDPMGQDPRLYVCYDETGVNIEHFTAACRWAGPIEEPSG